MQDKSTQGMRYSGAMQGSSHHHLDQFTVKLITIKHNLNAAS